MLKSLLLHPLGIYSNQELRSWVPYQPWLSAVVRIGGTKYHMDEYRFERKFTDSGYEYRAIPLSEAEILDRKAW